MGKKPKRCQKQCKKHKFQLKPVHYSAVFSRELCASFCPPTLRACSITPRFNKDNRHFTLSFIIPDDQKKLSNNEDYYKNEHDRCKFENEQEKSEVVQIDQTKFVAKPRAKSSYCSICKEDFDDYLQHIKEGNHKNLIKENTFNGFIQELSYKLQRKQRQEDIKAELIKISQFSESNLAFFTQQNTHFQQKSPLDHNCDYLNGFQLKQPNQFFQSPKNFHFLVDQSDAGMITDKIYEENECGFFIPSLSSFKKYSDISDGPRPITNIKPIIITGGGILPLNK